MTVRELIKHLETLPQDYLVVYKCCSDYTKMDADEVIILNAEDKEIVQHHNIPDQVRSYRSTEYAKKYEGMPKNSEPKFLDCVVFPGN